MFSLFVHFELWSLYLHVLRTQRILGIFILITHKSTRSENPTTWLIPDRGCGWQLTILQSSIAMATIQKRECTYIGQLCRYRIIQQSQRIWGSDNILLVQNYNMGLTHFHLLKIYSPWKYYKLVIQWAVHSLLCLLMHIVSLRWSKLMLPSLAIDTEKIISFADQWRELPSPHWCWHKYNPDRFNGSCC